MWSLDLTPLHAPHSPDISIGAKNVPDIVSVGTLLEAAGVTSLDETGLPITDSHRYGGITLVVYLTYNNFDDIRRMAGKM